MCNVCFDPYLGGNVFLGHNAAHSGVDHKGAKGVVVEKLNRGIEEPRPSKAHCISFQESFVR